MSVMGISYFIMITVLSFPLAFRALKITRRGYLSGEALIPAQALTIMTVVVQGLLISLGLILRFINV